MKKKIKVINDKGLACYLLQKIDLISADISKSPKRKSLFFFNGNDIKTIKFLTGQYKTNFQISPNLIIAHKKINKLMGINHGC